MISDEPPERRTVAFWLGDATRRDILACVLREEQSVSELARRYDMSFAAVQKHVAVLETRWTHRQTCARAGTGRERRTGDDPAGVAAAPRLRTL